MPYCKAPVNTRFPVNRKDHTKKGPYLIPLLKKFLEKRISYEDPETQKMIKGMVKDAVVWRLLLNACQGENDAIKEVFNRIDGKLPDINLDQSQHLTVIVKNHIPQEDKVASRGGDARCPQKL